MKIETESDDLQNTDTLYLIFIVVFCGISNQIWVFSFFCIISLFVLYILHSVASFLVEFDHKEMQKTNLNVETMLVDEVWLSSNVSQIILMGAGV